MATKGTSIKDALIKFEEKYGEKATEAKHIKLWMCIPPLEKMDASLSTLTNCTKLSLSTNAIEKIANLNGLKNLKILVLSRNNIKSLTGLEAVGETLQELWISYNNIEKLKGINVLKKLKVLYIAWNQVKDKQEFQKLNELSFLEELLFEGNPLVDIMDQDASGPFKSYAEKALPKLKKLDGVPVIREEIAEQKDQKEQKEQQRED